MILPSEGGSMRTWSRWALLAAVGLVPVSAHASDPRSHDGGFFLRASLGGGASHTKIDDGIDEVKIKGPSGTAELALGFGIGRNLILHANLGAWAAVDPTIEANGEEFETEDLSVDLSHFGGGLTYYLGDSNVFLTGFAGLGRLHAEVEGEESETDNGFAAGGGIGKEWWVGDRWGIGVMGTVSFHSIPEPDIDQDWKGTSFALQVTATLN
jgi:hypothetical protein